MSAPLLAMTWRDPLRYLVQEAVRDGLVDAVEVVPSGYAYTGLAEVLRHRLAELGLPYTFHFVEHSLASADYLDNNHHARLRPFLEGFEPRYVSEHLTCARVGDLDLEMNLPPIATEASVEIAVANIAAFRAQLREGQPFLLEHVPTYYRHDASTLDELDFYVRVVRESGCGMLVDLHNLYCDERNIGLDAEAFLRRLPPENVRELHVAGGHELGGPKSYVDGHDQSVPPRVLELLRVALDHAEPDLVVLEREHGFEDLDGIWRDLNRIREVIHG